MEDDEPCGNRPAAPRLFPELWTSILADACRDLPTLLRSTALNREIRSTCFATPPAKCGFLLGRAGGDVNGALLLLVKAHMMPDFIACLAVLVRWGALHDCRGEKGARNRMGRPCLLISLLGRADAFDAVSACLNGLSDAIPERRVCFSDKHRALAFKRAVDNSDLAMMGLLKVPGSSWTRLAPWWELVVKQSADVKSARGMAERLGILEPRAVSAMVVTNGITACVRKGGGFVALAKELVGERILAGRARAVWAEVNLADVKEVETAIGTGLRPTNTVVWKYLMEYRMTLPPRAADDAILVILLNAGMFKPLTREEGYRTAPSFDEYENSVKKVMEAPDLSRDLVDAGVLVPDHLDREIDALLRDTYWRSHVPDFNSKCIEVIRLLRDAGGVVSARRISDVVRSSAPDEFVAALIDLFPHVPKSEDVLCNRIFFNYTRALTRTKLLLARFFPVSLRALDVAIDARHIRYDKSTEDWIFVDLVQTLLEHADLPALVAEDLRRTADDVRVIRKALDYPHYFDEEGRIYPVVKLLVDAGFKVEEVDITLTSTGWVRTLALLRETLGTNASGSGSVVGNLNVASDRKQARRHHQASSRRLTTRNDSLKPVVSDSHFGNNVMDVFRGTVKYRAIRQKLLI